MAEPSRPARLWYQSFVHPTAQAPYIERLQALLDAVAGPGHRFEVHGLDPPDHLFHPLTEFRCAAQTIRNALEAERAGYDAFVIGHFQEPGLLEIRGAVDIPVVGLGEATLLAALSMGYRLGLVTIDPVRQHARLNGAPIQEHIDPLPGPPLVQATGDGGPEPPAGHAEQ